MCSSNLVRGAVSYSLRDCPKHNQETEMSKSIKAVIVLGLLTVGAACAQQEEEVVVVNPAPITVDPVSSKF